MSLPAAGGTAAATHTVTSDDTAIALGSGDVPVLATPRLMAWFEAATVAVAGSDAESASVGSHVEIYHLAPSPVGKEVTVRAELERTDGRRLHFFAVAEHSDGTVVARANIVRVVVDRAKFGPPASA
ncbi:MAG TPA: hotdog domain-containing protein [Jiangellaceae bacterium]